ncbi:molybdenum cofactor guanylyltransferase [Bacillus sp. SM2101]|uniref:molybdenum cofactor guanylyltransferase n=1 Tax=Bacillaceae TaxID=186817 RepID=UPI00332CAFDD
MDVGAIILAGGQSKRMGTNKALLRVEGKYNIVRMKEALQLMFEEIILVTNQEQQYKFLEIPIVPDLVDAKGPLAGLQAGLQAAQNDKNVVVACDMPFISTSVTSYLLSQANGCDAVVPIIGGKIHPLYAVYSKSALPIIHSCLKENQLKVVDVLSRLQVRYINEQELMKLEDIDLGRVFFNMNYPMDYEKVKRWVKDKDPNK